MPVFKIWHSATKRISVPAFERAGDTYRALSHTGRGLFLMFAALATLSSASLVYLMNANLTVAAPARGGSLTEGNRVPLRIRARPQSSTYTSQKSPSMIFAGFRSRCTTPR